MVKKQRATPTNSGKLTVRPGCDLIDRLNRIVRILNTGQNELATKMLKERIEVYEQKLERQLSEFEQLEREAKRIETSSGL